MRTETGVQLKQLMALMFLLGMAGPDAWAAEGQKPTPVSGDGSTDFRLGGYVRTWASFNLQNPPETSENDRWDASMLRASLLLDADASAGPVKLKAIGRLDREYKTNYLKRLENLNRTNIPLPGPGDDLMDTYNQGELREAHAQFDLGDRVTLRLGKQQVVWGETDFFRAMDVVHGFDYRWRSFLEVENEELRKPLILANAMIKVPEAKGSLQFIFRPGWDRDKDIGNTYELSGGRWAAQPNKGVDFLKLMNYDYRHPDADTSDRTWGMRWSGIAGPVNYSLAYLQTFNNDPVVNSAFVPYQKAPSGAIGDFIYPKIGLIGLTLSGYSPAADAVFSTEIAYTKDQAFNVGSNFFGGALPGFGGIKKKDTVLTMLRMDKQISLQPILGTSRPSFFSVQLFDTWIQNYSAADDIVLLAGYGRTRKAHSTIFTTLLGMNYMNDRINPTLALGFDLSYGGGFFIPSVEFVMGDKWRLKVEADLFFNSGQKRPGQIENKASLFGYFANNNQLVFRLTRQF